MTKLYCQNCDEESEFSDDEAAKVWSETFHDGHLVCRKVPASNRLIIEHPSTPEITASYGYAESSDDGILDAEVIG